MNKKLILISLSLTLNISVHASIFGEETARISSNYDNNSKSA